MHTWGRCGFTTPGLAERRSPSVCLRLTGMTNADSEGESVALQEQSDTARQPHQGTLCLHPPRPSPDCLYALDPFLGLTRRAPMRVVSELSRCKADERVTVSQPNHPLAVHCRWLHDSTCTASGKCCHTQVQSQPGVSVIPRKKHIPAGWFLTSVSSISPCLAIHLSGAALLGAASGCECGALRQLAGSEMRVRAQGDMPDRSCWMTPLPM